METIIFPLCPFCGSIITLYNFFLDEMFTLKLRYTCNCSKKNYHIADAEQFITLSTIYFHLKEKKDTARGPYYQPFKYYCYTCNTFIEYNNCLKKKHFVLGNYIKNIKLKCELHENNPNDCYCFECQKSLCITCKQQHGKKHNIILINDLYNQTKQEYIKTVNSNLQKYISEKIVQNSKIKNQNKNVVTSKLFFFYDFVIKCFLNCFPHPILEIIMLLKALLNVTKVIQTICIVHPPFKYKKTIIKGTFTPIPDPQGTRNTVIIHFLNHRKILVAENHQYSFFNVYSNNFGFTTGQMYSESSMCVVKEVCYPNYLIAGTLKIELTNISQKPWKIVHNYFYKRRIEHSIVKKLVFVNEHTLVFEACQSIQIFDLLSSKITKLKNTKGHVWHEKIVPINEKIFGILYQDRIEIWEYHNIKQIRTILKKEIRDCLFIDNKYLLSIYKASDGDYIVYWRIDNFTIDSYNKSSISLNRIVGQINNNLIGLENDEHELLFFDKETRQVVTVLKNWKCEILFHELAISPEGIKYVVVDGNIITVFL